MLVGRGRRRRVGTTISGRIFEGVRYRERWEKLKEGARVRREGTEKADEGTV